MIGPLPQLHRLLVLATVLGVGLIAGAWIALFTTVPIAASAGAALGGIAGLLIGYVLLHEPGHHPRHR